MIDGIQYIIVFLYVKSLSDKDIEDQIRKIYNFYVSVSTILSITDWESKYSYAVKSWKNNWEDLIVFFEYSLEIRKIIYTTNLI